MKQKVIISIDVQNNQSKLKAAYDLQNKGLIRREIKTYKQLPTTQTLQY